jgi:hypothetical protein
MPGGRHKQSRKRELAVANLLASATIEQAAQKTGISEKCLRLWLAEPDFSQAYRHARKLVLEQSITVMQQASLSAVAALVRNLSCGRPGVEVAAANSLLERGTAAIETFDVLTRLAALEQRAAQQGAANHAAFNGRATNGTPRNPLG